MNETKEQTNSFNKHFKWYTSKLFSSNLLWLFNGSRFVPTCGVLSILLSLSLSRFYSLSQFLSSFVCFHFVCGFEYTQSAVQHVKFTYTQFCHYLNIRLSSIRAKKTQPIHSTGTDKSTLIKELVAVETNPIFIACKCWSIVIGMQTSFIFTFHWNLNVNKKLQSNR